MTEQPRADERPPTEETIQEPTENPTESEAAAAAPSERELLEEAERERDQFKAMALRYAADLENYKKLAARDAESVRERANERLLMSLINVADNFGRALDSPPDQDADGGGDGDGLGNWLEGVRIAMRGLESVLASEGVSRIETAVGEPFDPNLHDALFQHPTDDVEEGAVSAVIQNGYRLHGRVLRAAQVGVARAATPKQEQSAETEANSATEQETN